MAHPRPGQDHCRREPGWWLEGGGGTDLLADVRSGGVLFAAGRFPVSGRLRRPHRGVELRARPHCRDRKSTRLNSSHANISYAVFCLKKKKNIICTKQIHVPPAL